jgi:hypothetical protein
MAPVFEILINLKNAVFWDVAPWRCRVNRRYSDLHGATSQKTTLFIVTAVKTSNLTLINLLICYIDFLKQVYEINSLILK